MSTEQTIDQELAILAVRMPNFAEILYKAAREGRMTGYTPPTQIIWPAGTIYTHLARGDVMRGCALVHEIRAELGQSKWMLTPLQKFLYTVRPGDKPATRESLGQFMEMLRPYLLYPDKAKPVTLSLWGS